MHSMHDAVCMCGALYCEHGNVATVYDTLISSLRSQPTPTANTAQTLACQQTPFIRCNVVLTRSLPRMYHVTQAQEVAFADSFVRAFRLEAVYPEVLAQRRQDKLQKLISKGKWRVAAALCGCTVDSSSNGKSVSYGSAYSVCTHRSCRDRSIAQMAL
jgi:hypothetical protein